MHRRSFLKTTAAALLVPTINLRREIDREALIAPFCDASEFSLRYDLRKPFLYGDSLTYASDYRAAIRTELDCPVVNGEGRLPKMLECWERTWKPVSQWEVSALTPMDELEASPKSWAFKDGFCPECDGRRISCGDTYPHGTYGDDWLEEHEYDIDDNTILDPSCPRCRGKTYYGPWLAEICGVPFRYSHAKRIFALPGVQVCRAEDNACVLFRADGFEGIAMGMSRV